MSLAKRYDPKEAEPRLSAFWQQAGVYHFEAGGAGEVYSIDTPPPTVSGHLHLGHVYSYSHPDFVARFWRMRGRRVYYPMGYDDNGLPTERLVEKRLGVRAQQVGRAAFIEKCLQVSEEAEKDYQELWQRLGLSIDWRYTYRTIDAPSRRIAQHAFLELHRQGLVYRQEAPAIWCPECRTAIAQAELNDLERQSEFVTLKFTLTPGPSPWEGEGEGVAIATTRPELLPACVAVFVHPEDGRFQHLVGRSVQAPLFGQVVPVLADPGADPEKGSGVVMCCTFGDTADVAWWRTHNLPLVEALDREGRMTAAAGPFAGLAAGEARKQIKQALDEQGLILGRQATAQSVRVHERCDTPVEYVVARQWFVKVLPFKEKLVELGERLNWRPAHMQARYRAWVENLNWDWCISRQRYYGVTFPAWYCRACGAALLAEPEQLPVDPSETQPGRACACGGMDFDPDPDVMDTWATSSLSPQIVGQYLPGRVDNPLYEEVFPYSLRPQAHEIIRTWAFYTIVQSHFHFDALPWKDVLISGWGIAGEGMGKISKSRGGGPLPPLEMIERYSADAVRYWASSTGPGKDAVISEEKIQMGARLATKLWNVARFSERFLQGYTPPAAPQDLRLTPADRWILAGLQRLIRRATQLLEEYDYAATKSEIESFFWGDLADNYLEMCKQRLYDLDHPQRAGALFALRRVLQDLLKLLAPFLPYVTEAIHLGLFAGVEVEQASRQDSLHLSEWPAAEPALEDEAALALGERLVAIATAVRRYKSERNLPLSSELTRLQLGTVETSWQAALRAAAPDLASVCRVQQVEVTAWEAELEAGLEALAEQDGLRLAILA
ncbi:MAG: valine--tRNA ligase [Chloroflexota bacterium]